METLRMLSKTPGSSDYEAEVERLLSCPICLEVYSKPVVILPCQHNLCRKCANDVFQNRGTPMGSGGRFRCPTCRYEVMLDRHGVYGLQRNILVENIIDMYQTESKKPFRKAEVLMCDEHEEEKVNIFCISCQKPTCSLCKVFGQHRDCTVLTMDKVYKDHKSELSSAISMLVAGNDRLQTVISSTEQTAVLVEENSKKAQNEVSSSFDQLYAVLEQRKQAMLSQIKAAAQEKSEILQSMLSEYGIQIQASSKLVEEALTMLEEPSHSQFLLISRDLINRVTSTARDAEVPKPPQHIQNVDEFSINLTEYVDRLKQIKFEGDDTDYSDISSNLRKESNRAVGGENVGDVFQAKLLLNETANAEEAVAAARVTKTDNDEDDDVPSTSTAFKSDREGDRKESYGDCAGLDNLDADVKAIAERYLSGRASRRRSHACPQGEGFGASEGRGNSFSDESLLRSLLERRRSSHNSSEDVDSDGKETLKSLHKQKYPSSHCADDVIGEVNDPKDFARTTNLETSSPRQRKVLRFQTDAQSSVDSDISAPEHATTTARRPSKRRQRSLYTSHRRRTWSHLLDKKP